MYNVYYLPFVITADVNYIYLLYLYGFAERDKGERIKSVITFASFDELAAKINNKYGQNSISASTLRRITKIDYYKTFFSYSKSNNEHKIQLNNNFSKENKGCFIRLTPQIYNLLIAEKDNLLAKYIIYLIYSCGISDNNSDFTANQFLSACGYSIKSNSYKSKLSEYNNLLEEERVININRYFDSKTNKMRNNYSLIDIIYDTAKKH